MATASSILSTNHAYPSCVHLCASCQGVTTSTAAANAMQHPGLAFQSNPLNNTDTAMRFNCRTRSTEPRPKFRQRTSALSWSFDRSESLSEAWRDLELPPLLAMVMSDPGEHQEHKLPDAQPSCSCRAFSLLFQVHRQCQNLLVPCVYHVYRSYTLAM